MVICLLGLTASLIGLRQYGDIKSVLFYCVMAVINIYFLVGLITDRKIKAFSKQEKGKMRERI